MEKRIKARNQNFHLTILLLCVVAVGLFCGAMVVREKLIENTNDYGMMLVKNYAEEEELNVIMASRRMDLAEVNLNEQKANGVEGDSLEDWFVRYRKKVSVMVGEGKLPNFLGIVDDRAYSAVENENVTVEKFKDTNWYKKAMKADGKVVFTGIYKSEVTGKIVTTVAKKMKDSDDVLAMNLKVDRNTYDNNVSNFIKSASFYVFDTDHKLFYYKTPVKVEQAEALEHSQKLVDHVLDPNVGNYGNTVVGEDGVKYGIYYTELINDSMVVMAVPVNDLMAGKKDVIMAVFLTSALIVLIIIAFLMRMNLKYKRNIDTAETLTGLLGDMYYAIYKVNFKTDTYECIKTTPDLEETLGENGSFIHLANILRNISWPRTNDNYVEENKLATIKKKHKKTYTYYGGEFMQKFGDEYKWVGTRIIQDGKLDPGESIWCFRLIDDEKKKELENTKILKETLLNSEKKEKDKSEFFSQMSHDMRTPLNAILGFADLSKSHQGDAARLQDYINKMEKSAKQLLLLINDILEYSRIGEGVKKLEKAKFNIAELIDDVENSFKENGKVRGKSIEAHIDVKHEEVYGDNNKLTKILNNLISNSLKYSNSGDSVSIYVKEFVIKQHSKFQIKVVDTGIGMSEEFQKKIFEPYTREQRRMADTEIMGTGLGMLIVKNLVTLMNGEISVQSQVGKGTTIIVTIPLEISKDQTKSVAIGAHCKLDEQQELKFFEGLKILVAEDNELNMEILCEMLKMRGVEVTKAWDGEAAVEQFENSSEGYFDCILMDMYMPKMDGCDATRKIRAMDRKDSKDIIIVAVTANAFAEDINKTATAGMNGHVSKPLDFKTLYNLLKNNLKK